MLKHVRPSPTRSRMTMLQVLPEMVRPEEFLARVALTKLVDILKMANALVPVHLRRNAPNALLVLFDVHLTSALKYLTAVAASISLTKMVY